MNKVKKLTLENTEFPEPLTTIPKPPKQLYVQGRLPDVSSIPTLAVVGSRKVSPYGRQVTMQLVSELANRGVMIVSGLALGVDSLAHRAALDGGGTTIAVLPSGLDRIYPASHHHLAQEILRKGGALVSEYAEGEPPLKEHFIARNRLVSGLSHAVLITEAAEKSGTLHTANFALEQGKTVLAVPGNVTSPLSQGTNNLIKAGALLVTEASDVLLALGISERSASQQDLFGTNEAETLILQLLQSGVSDAAILLASSKLQPADFNQTLTMLEITGKIRALGAGHWSLI